MINTFIRGKKDFPVFHADRVIIRLPCGQGQLSRIWKVQCDWVSLGKECCTQLSRRLWGGTKDELPQKRLCVRLPKHRLRNILLQFMGISPSLAFILFACKNVAFYTKQDFSRGHTVYGFWVFFCFLSESVDCERKSLDFKGRTWNGGKCGAIHTKAYLGSITSRCSGNKPALLLLLGRTEGEAEIEPGWCRQPTNTVLFS